ncbi:Uma2 family endonuclease [Actinoallomurus rhizosphaericola]|uniref:Uma2 family endonuclease n=1 Tax=Actinoallomurus rhizosphaericola TaxID=2952536 RepID=UPI0027E259A1|nr:Uma2 family endonuclease [Actinoallomurus rhizosphaericola]
MQLVDGRLVSDWPQTQFHMVTISHLVMELRRLASPDLRVRQGMTVTIGMRQRPEADILVVRPEGDVGMDQTTYRPEHVVLVGEVVSLGSAERDRRRKPQLYAEAGIPHFWRVEGTGGRPTVCVYERDPATNSYALTGIHHDRLKLTVPFAIDIDLTEADRL